MASAQARVNEAQIQLDYTNVKMSGIYGFYVVYDERRAVESAPSERWCDPENVEKKRRQQRRRRSILQDNLRRDGAALKIGKGERQVEKVG